MPAVAGAKQAAGRTIDDPVREEMVERSTMRMARDAGLDETAYLHLVHLQFAAAKMVQKAALGALPIHGGRNSEEGQRELNQLLRPAIDRLDRTLLRELGRLPPVDARIEDVTAALRADAPVPGLDDDLIARLGDALLRLTKAAKQ